MLYLINRINQLLHEVQFLLHPTYATYIVVRFLICSTMLMTSPQPIQQNLWLLLLSVGLTVMAEIRLISGDDSNNSFL
jgi:hypothetical protein